MKEVEAGRIKKGRHNEIDYTTNTG